MEAARQEQTALPALLEAGPQTCEKTVLILSTESWLPVGVEDTVKVGRVISPAAGLTLINMSQGTLLV
jgi:hypothetical protein